MNNDFSSGRYMVFCCDLYYPAGGTRDLVARTDDLTEALALCKPAEYTEWIVFDLESGEEVYEFGVLM